MTRLADLCGTWRGVLAHKRIGEQLDPDCRELLSARRRRYRRTRVLNQAGELLAQRPDLADFPSAITRLAAGLLENT